ncbi:MAG: HlyD family efflux transporter periplasmic adaptor subunit, partial [Muribaculaceae bacterium]|nr:HlyD family efflux transporter periplasmic adaptor subunit [Muribaculaceae bacterium]
VQAADLKALDLGINIASGDIDEMRRKLDDARLKAPRSATLTYIINEIGRQVSQGEKLAVIADLKHFKIEGEIPDMHAQKFGIGSKGIVKLGKLQFDGTVTNVVPQSQGGVIKFTITLDDNDNDRLRSGQSAQVYIVSEIREDVVRIPSGPYYSGPGIYSLFVKTDNDVIRRRDVRLGESNYEYVEVTDGLQPGDVVVTTNLNDYKAKNTLKLKNIKQ